ncbi:class I SAM-dependent methyltransferase [Sandaracinus amylolyticus]|uniref:class I SAM-dependent methyltransferase n=1 Tax=Sandaracinus amylolyticus TaxID=927083 RepID=UPI00147031A6|nr:class I SAM-dependent methyltransferase [Sandaracinus amylolyticus]
MTLWAGRFGDPEVRAFIAAHHYAGDPLAVLADERFELVRCHACALRYHARVLDANGLALLYGSWIDAMQIERFEAEHVPADRREPFAVGRHVVKDLLSMHALAGAPSEMRLLDFGCGDGRALRIASALGLRAVGVDPSVTRSERASDGGGAVHPTLEDALADIGGRVDAILMSEVLEHLVEPRRVLSSLVAAMRPGGVILIETPDTRGIDGPPRTFEHMRWVHPLEHVNGFTPETLERMARAVGLEPAPIMRAHATTRLRDVVRTEVGRLLARPSTSRIFVKP